MLGDVKLLPPQESRPGVVVRPAPEDGGAGKVVLFLKKGSIIWHKLCNTVILYSTYEEYKSCLHHEVRHRELVELLGQVVLPADWLDAVARLLA